MHSVAQLLYPGTRRFKCITTAFEMLARRLSAFCKHRSRCGAAPCSIARSGGLGLQPVTTSHGVRSGGHLFTQPRSLVRRISTELAPQHPVDGFLVVKRAIAAVGLRGSLIGVALNPGWDQVEDDFERYGEGWSPEEEDCDFSRWRPLTSRWAYCSRTAAA